MQIQKDPNKQKAILHLDIDHSDLKTAGDIHHSSQQGLPITISAADSVYKHQPPFPVWCSWKSQLTVTGLPNTQSRAPALSVSTQPHLSTLSQQPWLLLSPCTSQLWESSPCTSRWLSSTLPAWIICLGIIRLPWLKALMRCWSHHSNQSSEPKCIPRDSQKRLMQEFQVMCNMKGRHSHR